MDIRIVKSDRNEKEERLRASQIIGSKLKASNEEHESIITESSAEDGIHICTRFKY